MKKITTVFFVLVSITIFAQKKQYKSAEKAFKKGDVSLSYSIISDNVALFDSADDKIKNQVKFLSARIDHHNKNFSLALKSYKALKDNPNFKVLVEERLKVLSGDIITAAIEESEAKEFIESSKKLYMAYTIDNDAGMDFLYYASQNAINGLDYNMALDYLLQLKEKQYSGSVTNYFAKEVATGNEIPVDATQYKFFQKSDEYSDFREEETPSKYPEIVKNIALIYAKQDKTDKALEAVKEARLANPEDLNLILTAAEIYIELGEKEKFKELISQAIEKDPNNAILYFNLGVVNNDLGDSESARGFYEKAIEIDPSYETAYFNLTSLILSGESAIVDEMNSLGTSRADNARYDTLKSNRQALYLECVPFLNKLIDLNKNVEAIQTLMNIYGTIGDNVGYMKMKKLLE
ncbi:MAG: tetratricopeptide (TPR) repeat protein [Candidatus Marivariicella framensis]|jgi:tetratricopeptide (TPR) repeat protein|tara:strand:+ start:501 stop:1721 length:1221 start_codon:yes stop_codon:yes gene_type:complete